MLVFFADARGMKRDKKQDRMEAVIKLCNLDNFLHKPISKLSKGQRQRVGMAQTLLHEPDVLILDEPTAGLDPNQIREVRETIQKLGKDRTILLSTHILQEVEAMTNRVILINLGNIVFDGTIDEIRQDQETLDAAFNRYTSV
ncbi:MAG: ABC transporter ATP-binding protein, partial [Pseudomonadales bacterium]|nr:ABC transporter ATP-binding protein [Pseudomonadales bacterium]